MGVKGFYTAQEGHVVNVLPPVDISGGKVGQCFKMAKHGHASIILQVGVSAAAFTKILLNACSANDGTGATAQPFDIFKQETAGADKDVLGGRTPVTAAGYTPSGNDNIFYVIEVDADNLPVGLPYVQLQLTNGVNSVIASAVAILSGSRFASESSETVTA